MYYIKGINEIINSLHKVLNLTPMKPDLTDIKINQAYYDYLKNKSVFENYNFPGEIELKDFNGLKKISPEFCRQKEIHFSVNSPVLTNRLSNGFFINALSQLKNQNAELYQLASFLIKIILLNQLDSYTDGTTENTLGLSCMDFKDHFKEQDFIELVIHQMTHMILFLDDQAYHHLPKDKKLLMVETGAKYIFGGTQYPLYQAFHSYIVGVEVLNFRWETTGLSYNGNYHGDTARIIRLCTLFKKCLINHFDMFSDRGQSILNDSFVLLDNAILAYNAV